MRYLQIILSIFLFSFVIFSCGEKEEYESFQAYLDEEGRDLIKDLCAQLKEVPTLEEDRSYYIDLNTCHAIRSGMVQAILNLGELCSGRHPCQVHCDGVAPS